MKRLRHRPERSERVLLVLVMGGAVYAIGAMLLAFELLLPLGWGQDYLPDWPWWGWVAAPFIVGTLYAIGEIVLAPMFEGIFGPDRVEDPTWKRGLRLFAILAIFGVALVFLVMLDERGWLG